MNRFDVRRPIDNRGLLRGPSVRLDLPVNRGLIRAASLSTRDSFSLSEAATIRRRAQMGAVSKPLLISGGCAAAALGPMAWQAAMGGIESVSPGSLFMVSGAAIAGTILVKSIGWIGKRIDEWGATVPVAPESTRGPAGEKPPAPTTLPAYPLDLDPYERAYLADQARRKSEPPLAESILPEWAQLWPDSWPHPLEIRDAWRDWRHGRARRGLTEEWLAPLADINLPAQDVASVIKGVGEKIRWDEIDQGTLYRWMILDESSNPLSNRALIFAELDAAALRKMWRWSVRDNQKYRFRALIEWLVKNINDNNRVARSVFKRLAPSARRYVEDLLPSADVKFP